MASVELWSSDTFNRDSEPSLERTYPSIDGGLEGLWEHVLQQGIGDDGRPTFTEFRLGLIGGRSVSLPRDPGLNPELAALRAFRKKPHFLGALAKVHQDLLDQPFDFGPFLAMACALPDPVRQVAEVLRAALSLTEELRREGASWRAGPAGGAHVATSSGYEGEATWWWVKLPGLQFEGRPVRFGVYLEQDAQAGWSSRVESDDSPAAQPLRDALLSAGL